MARKKLKFKKLTPEEERDIEQRCYKRFEKSKKLQGEFRSRECYAAYIKGKWMGLIRD